MPQTFPDTWCRPGEGSAPIWRAKLLGKQGPWTLAALTVQSEPETGARANYAVGRVQRDVFGRSSIAVMAANRHLDGVNEGAVSVDTTLLFGPTFNFTGQWLSSHGHHRDGNVAWFVRPRDAVSPQL
jgi:hypothetical protein